MLKPLSPGKWILCGAVLAFVLMAKAVEAAETNQPPKSSDRLESLSLEQLVNVKVTSVSKKETQLLDSPAAISVITQDDIQRMGATSIPEALRMVPGIDVAQINANEWAVSVRGFNAQFANKLLVLIDGRSVYTPASGGVFWNSQSVLMEDLERIEVIRGPGAALWGANAVDGVINIVSKSARETQGLLLTATGGSQVQPLAAARYGGELASNLYYRVYVQRSDDAQFRETGGPGAGDSLHGTLGGFRLDWEPQSRDVLTLQGDYYADDAGALSRRLTLSPANTSFPSDIEYNNGGNILGRWTHDFSESSQLTLQTYFDHVAQDDTFGVENQNTYDVDLQQHFAIGTWNDIVGGMGYRYASVQNTPSFELRWTPEVRYVQIFNLFGQDEVAIVPDHLRFTFGLKLEYDNLVGWEPQPDARLVWTPTAKQSVWASVSRAIATPPLEHLDGRLNVASFQPSSTGPPALVSVLANPGLGAERLTACQLGYRGEPVERLSFEATTFYNVYNDLIVPVANPARFETIPAPPHLLLSSTWKNAGSGETYGAELSGQFRVTDFLRVTASYSWLDTQLGAAEASLGQSPQQQFQVRSYLDLPHDLQLNGAVSFVDRSASPLGAGLAPIPAYARVDLGLVWHPTPSLEVGIWGQNLQQREHVEFSSQQTPALVDVPRTVLAKVTWRF